MSETVRIPATVQTYASSEKPSTPLYTAAKNFSKVKGAVHYSFIYTTLPAQLAAKTVVSAQLKVTMGYDAAGDSRQTTVQRHAKPTSTYAAMTWNNKPSTLAGSSAVSVTQASTSQIRTHDVTADLVAIKAGAAYYGWRLISSYAAASWNVYGVTQTLRAELVVELGAIPAAPNDLGPNGSTTVAAPVFTWTPDNDIVSAQLQIDEDGGDFSAPLFDSGVEATDVGQLDSDDLGWAGVADGVTYLARVRQTNDLGTSSYSLPVTVTRDSLNSLAITSPTATTTDPTPPVSWTFTGQDHWRVTLTSGTATLHDTGMVPGTDTVFTPPAGATRTGQALTYRVRVWDASVRTPTPGDPGYAESTVTTTYTPGAAAAVTTLTADQDGVRPWVDLEWTRAAGLPDEWLITRDDEILARIPSSDGAPVWTYRDWTSPPNTDVTYNVRPIVTSAAGAQGPVVAARTVVTGAWVVDPETEEHFSVTGEGAQLAFTEQSVLYRPVGRAFPVKRTFALGGREGPVSGRIADYDGRTMAEQLTDLLSIKARPSATFRYVGVSLNVPVVLLDLTDGEDVDRSLVHAIRKTVSFTAIQNGELPFDELTP